MKERESKLRKRGEEILRDLEDISDQDTLALFTDLYVFLAVIVFENREDARTFISEHIDTAWETLSQEIDSAVGGQYEEKPSPPHLTLVN